MYLPELMWPTYLAVNEKLLILNRTSELESKFVLLLALADKKGCLTEEWFLKWVTMIYSSLYDVLLVFQTNTYNATSYQILSVGLVITLSWVSHNSKVG